MDSQDNKELISEENKEKEKFSEEISKKKGPSRRKTVFWILAIAMMVMIFVFSSKSADDSTIESHRVGKFIGYMLEYDFENWTADAQDRYAQKYDHAIRKTAHFLEYMTLAILIFGAVYDSPYEIDEDDDEVEDVDNKKKKYELSDVKKKRKKIDAKNTRIPWCFATLYAISDEFHQTFVSGRSGEPLDVCIDGSGALLGVILAFAITKLIGRYINS